ncbi:TadE/TadG family type IV pilus assembly protein [Paraburkholderia rhizosphaerae]|nr:TadE family protein [Paraburkholderia rhizosphaerae]
MNPRPNRERKRRGARATTRRQRGTAAIEMALLLPILVAIALPVVDFARNMQAQMILINVSREGANLASRASLTFPMQTIMSSLTMTTPPLNMSANGMIYITQIIGNNNCDANGNNCTGVVVAQYRWNGGNDAAASSKLWNCGSSGGTSWSTDGTGSCAGLPSPGKNSPQVALLQGQLSNGQIAYAVEAFYVQPPLIGGMNLSSILNTPALSPDLYAMTVF